MTTPTVLTNSPLSLVLAQVRFPSDVTAFAPERLPDFDEIMSEQYPMARNEQEPPLQIQTPAGTIQIGPQQVRRVYMTSDLGWRVALSNSFITVYSAKTGDKIQYQGREDCVHRLEWVVSKLSGYANGVPAARIGYRYVDVLKMDTLDSIHNLFQSPTFGLGCHANTPENEIAALNNDIILKCEESSHRDSLHVRCSIVPAGTVLDQSIPPTEDSSWVVDIDSFHDDMVQFKPYDIKNVALRLANHGHDFFFNHIITTDFIQMFK